MRRVRPAFTLIELLVAITITVVLILFVNQIFSSVTAGMNQGLAIGTIMQNSRVVLDQLIEDASFMVGPRDGGFLVIVHHVPQNSTGGVPVLATDLAAPAQKFRVRSDQLAFIRVRGGMQPVMPGVNTQYTPLNTLAQFVRVWYGHGEKLNTDGTDGPNLGADVVAASIDRNELAANWILARHAMFLDPRDPSDPGLSGSSIYADNLKYDGNVQAVTSALPTQQVFGSLADVALMSFETVRQAILTGAEQPFNYAFPVNRLKVNPVVSGDFETWRISQAQTILALNVSEFAIDVAGDYEAPFDGQPDTVQGADIVGTDKRGTAFTVKQGTIKWYAPVASSNFANEPVSGMAPNFDLEKAWTFRPPTELQNHRMSPATSSADHTFQFTSADSDAWPHMIRIRYRVHDPQGRVAGGDGDPGYSFEQIIRIPR